MFVYGLLDFGVHKLDKICALRSFRIRLGPTCALTILDRSTVLVEATAVVCVMDLELPPILLALSTMLVSPAHLLGFLWNPGVNRLHLVLPFSPV